MYKKILVEIEEKNLSQVKPIMLTIGAKIIEENPKEKKIIKLVDENSIPHYLKLSNENVKMLEYLMEEDMLRYEDYDDHPNLEDIINEF